MSSDSGQVIVYYYNTAWVLTEILRLRLRGERAELGIITAFFPLYWNDTQ